jgi:hypothetical protein
MVWNQNTYKPIDTWTSIVKQAKIDNELRLKQQENAETNGSSPKTQSKTTNKSTVVSVFDTHLTIDSLNRESFNFLLQNSEVIKELRKRNGNGGSRTRPNPKKEINIEDLIEGKTDTDFVFLPRRRLLAIFDLKK